MNKISNVALARLRAADPADAPADPREPYARALLDRVLTSDAAVTPARERAGTGARARLLPTWAARTGIAAVAAAALAAGIVVTIRPADNTGPTNGISTATFGPAANTMELAAVYAAAQPFTPPRPDQWAYIELKIVVPDLSRGGAMTETLRKSWYRIDGTQIAIPDDSGRIVITTHPEEEGRVAPLPTLNAHDYPTLAGMPSDPQALLTFLRAGLDPVTDPNLDRTGSLFGLIDYILRENVLPPQVTAALLRAAALIPGVTQVPGTITIDGHDAIAVGRVDGWTREEILLDPATKEFLGSRSVAVEDQPSSVVATKGTMPEPTGGPQQSNLGPAAKKGDVQYVITRGHCAIVDTPGEIN